MAGRLILVAAAPPLGRGLSGYSSHHPGLVLQAGLAGTWDYTARRQPGRPPTTVSIKKVVLRMAMENPA
jgi:hypothetical protein